MRRFIVFILSFFLFLGCVAQFSEVEIDSFLDDIEYYSVPIRDDASKVLLGEKTTLFDGDFYNGRYKESSSYYDRVLLNGAWSIESEGEMSTIDIPSEFVMEGVKTSDLYIASRSFSLPKSYLDNRLILRFESVYSSCEVFINEKSVGSHNGGFSAFDLDISDYVVEGKNSIRVDISGNSEADIYASGNQYAAHDMAGILRDVFIFPSQTKGLKSIAYEDSIAEDGTFSLLVKIEKELGATGDLKVVIPALNIVKSFKVDSEGESQQFIIDSLSPKLWNPQEPNIYNILVDYSNEDSTFSFLQRRGFRTIKIEGSSFLVNGKPIKLKGANRHSIHPNYGRAINNNLRRMDVLLFKEANLNYIRTSHYPPAPSFLEYCDIFGLFVEVEAPLCWVGHGANDFWKRVKYNNRYHFDYLLQANIENIKFNREHTSILIWSLANESLWSRNFADVHTIVKFLDTTRPFTFHDQAYGTFNNHGSSTEVANMHYPGPNFEQGVNKIKRPILFGEYTHVNVYNRQELVSDPGLRDQWGEFFTYMWNKMDSRDDILGGAIWSGIDDYFVLDGDKAVGYGPWGVIDGYRRKKPEYWSVKKAYSSFRLNSSINEAGRAKLKFSSKLIFGTVDSYNFYLVESGNREKIDSIEVNDGSFVLTLAKEQEAYGEFLIEIENRLGVLVDRFGFNKKMEAPAFNQTNSSKIVKADKNGGDCRIDSDSFSLIIENGAIKAIDVKKSGERYSFGTPSFTFVPLKGEGCFPAFHSDIDALESDSKILSQVIDSIESVKDGVLVKICEKNSYGEGEILLTISNNMQIGVKYDFTFKSSLKCREAGVKFYLDKRFENLHWIRDNFLSAYPLTHIGRKTGDAKLFYKDSYNGVIPFSQPNNSFAMDNTKYGSNDFRTGRGDVWLYQLSTDGLNLAYSSKSGMFCRSILLDGDVQLSCCGYSSGGNEMFFAPHIKKTRVNFSPASRMEGSFKISIF